MNFAPGLDRTVDDRAWLVRHNAAQERAMAPRAKSKAFYLKLGSGREQVVGESQDRYHVGWIRLRSLQFEPSPAVVTGTGTGGGPGKAPLSELTLSKFGDRNSQELFLATSNGRHFRSALLEVADEDTGIPRFRMSFTDVLVTSFSQNPNVGPNDPAPIDVFRISFGDLEYNYNPVPEPDAVDMLQSIFKSLGLAAVNDPWTSATGREGTGVGKPGFSEIVVSKLADDSSTQLYAEKREKTSGRR
jgi:type VI protein secretion system component Hcp